MKKLFALLIAMIMCFSLAACNAVKTKDQVQDEKKPAAEDSNKDESKAEDKDKAEGESKEEAKDDKAAAPANTEKVPLRLLGMSFFNEKESNVLRDQLTKAGFEVTMSMQPDYGSFLTQEEAGNWDISVNGWTTVTGNPDYAVRSLFRSDGDHNHQFKNEKIDELIDLAASQTPDQYVETYKEFEKELVDVNAYALALVSGYKSQAFNKTVLKDGTVRLCRSRSVPYEQIRWEKDPGRPMYTSQTMANLTSLDPIKGNDGSINIINTNMYVRLVNLTDLDAVTSEGSLSYNHAIEKGNSKFYFILRDDINFAKVKDKKAVDSGELVGGEDVVFSINRAKDKDSVPDHRTYSLYSSIDNIELVTDLAALDAEDSTGKTLKEVLSAGLEQPIEKLVADKADVDNSKGAYQVVCITTKFPFPQVLNYLAHQSAGIVSQKQIEAVNTYDVATFNRETDVAYGDQSTVMEGGDNTLCTSGPYIMVYKDDYEARLMKNPAYRKGSEFEPEIEEISVKFFKDNDSSLSALRSGEVDLQYTVPETKYEIIENDPNLVLQKMPSNSVSYILFNMKGPFQDVNLRQAVRFAIDQQGFIAAFNGNKLPAYSTVSPMVDTGNVMVHDMDKVKEYLSKYAAEKK